MSPAKITEGELAQFFRVPVVLPCDYEGREILAASRISNISQHGCFVATTKPLPVGTRVELRFQLPGLRETMRLQSIVRWSRGSPKNERPVGGRAIGMGLQFEGLSRAQKAQIKDYIRKFILQMRERPKN